MRSAKHDGRGTQESDTLYHRITPSDFLWRDAAHVLPRLEDVVLVRCAIGDGVEGPQEPLMRLHSVHTGLCRHHGIAMSDTAPVHRPSGQTAQGGDLSWAGRWGAVPCSHHRAQPATHCRGSRAPAGSLSLWTTCRDSAAPSQRRRSPPVWAEQAPGSWPQTPAEHGEAPGAWESCSSTASTNLPWMQPPGLCEVIRCSMPSEGRVMDCRWALHMQQRVTLACAEQHLCVSSYGLWQACGAIHHKRRDAAQVLLHCRHLLILHQGHGFDPASSLCRIDVTFCQLYESLHGTQRGGTAALHWCMMPNSQGSANPVSALQSASLLLSGLLSFIIPPSSAQKVCTMGWVSQAGCLHRVTHRYVTARHIVCSYIHDHGWIEVFQLLSQVWRRPRCSIRTLP